MSEHDDETIPSSWIEEGLFDHLVITHDIHPDLLAELREGIPDDSKWLRVLVRSHFILHKLDENGEYQDEHVHYKKDAS